MPGGPSTPRAEPASVLNAVILGTDAVMAILPAEPIQLASACLHAGFDFVAPVSWGEELLATRVADVVSARRPPAVVLANCPFVAEALRATHCRTAIVASVSPPVAAARYLRAAFPSRTVHVTYVGACPGATVPDVDERLLPDVFLAGLAEAGIDVGLQPRHLEGRLPPDRARHASITGGAPDPAWLARSIGATQLEATPATVDAVAALHPNPVVLDLGAACGCACARERAAAERMDPPRAIEPVVLRLSIRLADHRLLPVHRLVEIEVDAPGGRPLVERIRELRATFVARGLSEVDALRPEPLTSRRVGNSLEGWSADRPTPAPPRGGTDDLTSRESQVVDNPEPPRPSRSPIPPVETSRHSR